MMINYKNWKPTIPVNISFTEGNVTKAASCDLKICKYNPLTNMWTIIAEIPNLENDLFGFESKISYPTK